jgi:hypothetical protein
MASGWQVAAVLAAPCARALAKAWASTFEDLARRLLWQ